MQMRIILFTLLQSHIAVLIKKTVNVDNQCVEKALNISLTDVLMFVRNHAIAAKRI